MDVLSTKVWIRNGPKRYYMAGVKDDHPKFKGLYAILLDAIDYISISIIISIIIIYYHYGNQFCCEKFGPWWCIYLSLCKSWHCSSFNQKIAAFCLISFLYLRKRCAVASRAVENNLASIRLFRYALTYKHLQLSAFQYIVTYALVSDEGNAVRKLRDGIKEKENEEKVVESL